VPVVVWMAVGAVKRLPFNCVVISGNAVFAISPTPGLATFVEPNIPIPDAMNAPSRPALEEVPVDGLMVLLVASKPFFDIRESPMPGECQTAVLFCVFTLVALLVPM
jgi:hypothetical protein